ncbi:hypothetical protein ABL78_3720 [Leptomonas seymouri]|uniref:Tetratricopeptide repeat family protein n=1 Tax=Leptomonas seymouri TaxID=5684 RepID=A0A0N1PBN7_LEPSE|nr:hypothetical protein ABL78_3720 [Leptomonas seymouri]|eukprot:KPI87204.1 hypothetical protein ABL78_3720 [Leptomonas seymouri]
MDVTTAAAHYADATRHYHQGNLHRARDIAEQTLLSLSSLPADAESPPTDGDGSCIGSSLPAAAPRDASLQRRRHHLFANILLLLSTIYAAVGDYAEAQRLLSTCEGYLKEHCLHTKRGGRCSGTEAANEGGETACRDLDEGLAGVAYNKAVLQLEMMHHTGSPAVTRSNDRAALPSAAWTSVLPSLPPSATLSPVLPTQDEEQRRQTIAAEALEKYLYDARDKLSHTLGSQRCLLADVYHSCGVCQYYLKDYVAALDAWQQSMAIRVHVRSDRLREQGSEGSQDAFSSGVEELKTALTLEHIAHVYQLVEGKAADAMKIYDTVAATRERYLGPAHPLYARTLLEKAVLASGLGRAKLARALLDACHGICTRSNSECSQEFSREVQRWSEYVGFPIVTVGRDAAP